MNSPGRGGYWGGWWCSGCCCWWCSTSGGGLQGVVDDTGGRGELLMSSILMAAIATWNTDWLNAIETLRLSERAKPKQGQKWRAGSSQRLHFFGTSLSLSFSSFLCLWAHNVWVCVRNLYLRFSTFAAYFLCCCPHNRRAHTKNCQCVYSCVYTKLVNIIARVIKEAACRNHGHQVNRKVGTLKYFLLVTCKFKSIISFGERYKNQVKLLHTRAFLLYFGGVYFNWRVYLFAK